MSHVPRRVLVVQLIQQGKITYDTAKEYAHNLYRHFKMKNRNELLARFFMGEDKSGL